MKIVKVVYVKIDFVECPHCGEAIEGFVADPRGTVTECDECGKEVRVSDEAAYEVF